MNDPYKILGVSKNATDEEIKKAFKAKAILLHPDKNPGDPKALTAFQEVSGAYDILKDPQKKAAYDQTGQNPFQGGFGGSNASPFRSTGFNVPPDFHDILSEMFGGRQGGFNTTSYNQHIALNYQITLEEAYHGKETDVSFSAKNIGQRSVRVKVPAAIEDGMRIRYTGLGEQINKNMPPGDLYISIGVVPHSRFTRVDKYTLLVKQRITYIDAILGCNFEIAAIDGTTIDIKVPSGVNPGAILKAQGKGMRTEDGKRGDLLIELSIVAPTLTVAQLDGIKAAIK